MLNSGTTERPTVNKKWQREKERREGAWAIRARSNITRLFRAEPWLVCILFAAIVKGVSRSSVHFAASQRKLTITAKQEHIALDFTTAQKFLLQLRAGSGEHDGKAG